MYDVAIIGAGTMGMAAGFYLARDGKKVALIDKYDPPHEDGAHHGESRIIRRAHMDQDTYTPLASRAHILFKELQVLALESLYINDGMLCFGPKNNTYAEGLIATAEALNIPHERLTGAEINDRWPGFSLPDDYTGYLEIDTGVLLSHKVIATYKRLASESGTDFYMNSTVRTIDDSGDTVRIDVEDNTIEAKQLIITGGKRVNDILALIDYKVPITVLRKTFTWFDGEADNYRPEIFPAWTCVFEDGLMYYGFPNIEVDGIKVGRHDGGREIDPQATMEPFGYYDDDYDSHITDFVDTHFSAGDLNVKSGDVCTYSMTPDKDFIIDTIPGHEKITLACGFSGHGFKFSSAIGEALALKSTDRMDECGVDLEMFALSRF